MYTKRAHMSIHTSNSAYGEAVGSLGILQPTPRNGTLSL